VRSKTPIYVDENVLERAGVTLEQNEESAKSSSRPDSLEEAETDDNLDAYRDFINSLDVLDEFGKE